MYLKKNLKQKDWGYGSGGTVLEALSPTPNNQKQNAHWEKRKTLAKKVNSYLAMFN
jgi:hypothetical protein